MIHRPEDVGLKPYSIQSDLAEQVDGPQYREVQEEINFTRKEASRTRIFWVLIAISVFIYPVQAGVSLHQAPHLIDRGLSLGVAASAVSAFSIMSAVGALVFGHLEAQFGLRQSLAASAALMAFGTATMLMVTNALDAYLSAVVFGLGIGGLFTLFPLAWAIFLVERIWTQYVGSHCLFRHLLKRRELSFPACCSIAQVHMTCR